MVEEPVVLVVVDDEDRGVPQFLVGGQGPVTFPGPSRWRRKTFSDFTGALRLAKAQPAPSNTQFTPATTAANLAAQQAAALLPLPPRPGATQQFSGKKDTPGF